MHHTLAMSSAEHTRWVVAIIIGFVVVLAVAGLLSLLIYLIKRIDRRVVEVRDTLQAFDPLWNQLFPAEQSRIIELLVERVDVRIDRVDIKLRIAGVTSLIGELTGNSTKQRDAA